MAERPKPYVQKYPDDIIRSGDWNELQIQAREEIHGHKHTGNKDGSPIPRAGIEEKAIDGSRIDPDAALSIKALEVKETLSVNNRSILDNINDLLNKVKGLEMAKVNRKGDSFTGDIKIDGSLSVTKDMNLGDIKITQNQITCNGIISGKKIKTEGDIDVQGALRLNDNDKQRISGASRNNRNTLVVTGHWNELEIKGRVIDWTGSNLHIGYDNDHSNDSIFLGNGKLKKVEIQGTTDLVVGGDIKTNKGFATVTQWPGVKIHFSVFNAGKSKGMQTKKIDHGQTFSSKDSYFVIARACENHSSVGGAVFTTYECKPISSTQFIIRWHNEWKSDLTTLIYYMVIGY